MAGETCRFGSAVDQCDLVAVAQALPGGSDADDASAEDNHAHDLFRALL
jgi:hypothetical protein